MQGADVWKLQCKDVDQRVSLDSRPLVLMAISHLDSGARG